MAKSTTGNKSRKRGKPSADFPLFRHNTGRWCRKIAGRFCYFGKVADDPDGKKALDQYLKQRDDLVAGRKPHADYSGLSLEDLVNHFLHFKDGLVKSGELAPRTWERYKNVGEVMVAVLGRKTPVTGLRPEDFQRLREKMATRLGSVALGVEMQCVRSVFLYGYQAEMIDSPVRFGPGFKKPSAKALRQARLDAGPSMFTAAQIHALLAAATVNMRAMILLGINGGLGNTDIGTMTLEAWDAAGGWLDYPRPKTAIKRRIPLWEETKAAVAAMLEKRRAPTKQEATGLLFMGRHGVSYEGGHRGYRVTQEFTRTCAKAGIAGMSFYDLRRTFQTVAEDSCDLVAVQAIMGHAPPANDMSSVYRQRLTDERLRKVVQVVHDWLYAPPAADDDGDEGDILPFRTVG